MSNTLKFGGGQWATKEGSTLAYNDLNSNYKPLPFDFTRASSATVVNKAGLIETVGSGQPRIDFQGNTKGSLLLEPSRTNLITQSEAFGNNYWTKSGAIIQGDASTTGSELITVLADRNFSSDTGFWVKSSAWTISGGKLNVNGSLDTGTGTSCWKPSFLTVGKTYQITFTISNYVSGSFALLQESGGTYYTSNGTFTQTFQAVSTGLGFNRSLSFGGITNMSIDNVSLKEVQGFASPSADSPLGAFKLVEGTNNGEHSLIRNLGGLGVNTYAHSIRAKASERTHITLSAYGNLADRSVFNLSNGTITNYGNAIGKIKSLGDGWYDCSVSATSSSSGIYSIIWIGDEIGNWSYQGDGTSGIYIYGAQLEQGSYSTSIIKTEGSAVTRIKDLCIKTVPENIIDENEMTLYCEFEYLGGGDTIPISVHNSSSSVIWLALNSNSTIYGSNFYNGVFNGSSTSTTVLLPNTKYKVAYRTKSGDSVLYLDGVLEASSNDVISNPHILNKVELGSFWNGTNQNPNLKIINAQCYNSGLSNSELASLTS